MEEGDVTERPSESRIKEAVELEGVSDFIVACPKDVTMYRDAVKTTGNEERLAVIDLIELVQAAL
jgi:Fe-S oxidoreductase